MGDPKSASFFVIDGLQMTLIWCLYYGFLESSRKQGTFGKQSLGMRACDINGNRLSFTHAVAGFLMGFIAVAPFGIGRMMVGWTKRKQGLHNMICRCLVIRTSASEQTAGGDGQHGTP